MPTASDWLFAIITAAILWIASQIKIVRALRSVLPTHAVRCNVPSMDTVAIESNVSRIHASTRDVEATMRTAVMAKFVSEAIVLRAAVMTMAAQPMKFVKTRGAVLGAVTIMDAGLVRFVRMSVATLVVEMTTAVVKVNSASICAASKDA